MMESNAEPGPISIGLTNNADRSAAPANSLPLSLAPRLIFSAVSASALAAGVLASGASLAASASWLAVLIGLVLTQIVWNTLWATLAETPWAQSWHEGRRWQAGPPLHQLPYTQPGTASAQVSIRLGQLNHWLTQQFWPRYGAVLASTVGAVIIGIVLALVLGPQPAMLTLVAVCVPQVAALLSRGNGQPSPIARGIIMAGLPLLLGHALFAPLPLDVILVALGFAVAFAGIGQSQGRLHWGIGIMIVIGVLAVTRRPLGAYTLAVLALPQTLLSPSRYAKGWFMAMLLAAGTAIS